MYLVYFVVKIFAPFAALRLYISHYAQRPLPQMPDMKQAKRSVCNHIRHFYFLTSHLRQHRRETTKHKSFVFYLSLISSSSIIVFNQQHRWVAHSTPTPAKNYPIFHSLISPAANLPRSSLILPANTSITIIPPTTPCNPKSILSKTSTHSTRSTRL